MSQTWTRVAGGVVTTVVATIVGLAAVGGFTQNPSTVDPSHPPNVTGANSFALILAVAVLLGFVAYAAIEYAQTRRLDSISRQFDTRTIVLMPLAIAFNIILGQAVGTVLKVPIYLDSIGTILVAALAGPFAGALTGLLSNLLWTYVVPPPFQSPYAAPFAIVAVVIGLLAGMFARAGFLRPRPHARGRELAIGAVVAIGLIVIMAALAVSGYTAIQGSTGLTPQSSDTLFLVLGWVALILVVGTAVGLLYLLFVRRDLSAAFVVVAGVLTGLVAAVIAAPISANLFGGVTGAGTDFLVAALRQGGADVAAATLGQSFISDPIDKVTTFFVVYLILGAMALRTKARFPNGEALITYDDRLDPTGSALRATR